MNSDWHIISITLSRSSAPVEVREQLSSQDWVARLAGWDAALHEWAILTTCHRFELYAVTTNDHVAALTSRLQEMLATVIGTLALDEVAHGHSLWTVKENGEAAEHLCRVAAGLDSLVLGEAQIQGQVISTYTEALEAGTIGPVLSSLFRAAIRTGKRARTETHISTRAISMSSVALSMAALHFPNFQQARVLVIGAGEMSQLALKALLQRQVTDVTVANRTLARAEAALLHPAWKVLNYASLVESLGDYDVIFSATSAPDFVVTHEHFFQVVSAGRENETRVLIDLAVPRDVDPAIRHLPGVALIDVDDLRQGLDDSLAARSGALPAVNAIVNAEMARWQTEQRELIMRPYVVELRQRAERIRQDEVERTMRFIGPVDEATQTHIQHLSRALVNKLLHEPTVRIKELAHEDEAATYVSAICDIFGLEIGSSVPQESISQKAVHALHVGLSNGVHNGSPNRDEQD